MHLCFFKTKFVFVLIAETSADAPRYSFPSPISPLPRSHCFSVHCKPFNFFFPLCVFFFVYIHLLIMHLTPIHLGNMRKQILLNNTVLNYVGQCKNPCMVYWICTVQIRFVQGSTPIGNPNMWRSGYS